MTLTEFLEKWGKTMFETPLATSTAEPPELAEIRLAALARIREKCYRSGGRKVFPYDLLRVELRGVEEDRRDIFSGRFFRQYLEQEVRQALRDSGCRFPENLRLDVRAAAGLPQLGEPWLVVEVASQERAAGAPCRLIVMEGAANVPELVLDKTRVNIGRVVDVYRAEGLYRRNDLTFPEEESISREHAHILFDKAAGEYRLFNDRWYPRGAQGDCGTWIVRDGMSQQVHRNARGARLEPGDEIHFGRAVVVFDSLP